MGIKILFCGMTLAVVGASCNWIIGLDDYTLVSTTSTSSGGDGGGTPERCVPSANSAAVADDCGVFVSRTRGADTHEGTKGAPLKTMGAALARAEEKGMRVYACAEPFEERLEMPAGRRIFGGLDCTRGWVYVGGVAKTTLMAPEGEIPLTVRGGEGTAQLDDVHVKARSIEPANVALRGASSIAMVVDGVAVEISESVIEAGDAAPGAEGEAYTTEGMSGGTGNTGGEACSANYVFGGEPPVNDCGTAEETDDSYGGPGGGASSVGAPAPGGPGYPGDLDNKNGGSGEYTTACAAGTAGNGGTEGGPGAGATGIGSISASGYTGVAGGNGTRGAPAQGGGGGGGAKGGTGADKCPPGMAGGASGGSGGSGGCGGAGGKGGGPGGASIAIVSIDAEIVFNGVLLQAGRGGAGGPGGAGQAGGAGASGGQGGVVPDPATMTGLKPGCAGGPGGVGGIGGKGGGGLGGHAIAILFQGAPPSTQGATLKMGEAGLGGPGADVTYDGDPGVAADKMEFPR